MNIRETRVLLQFLAAVDRRTVDDDVVAGWTVLLEEVDSRDGMTGVKYLLREQPDLMIKPGHVLAAAREARKARIHAEQMAWGAQHDVWGNRLGSPEAIEARERFEQARRERWEAPPLKPIKVVPSPFQKWERERRRHARRADSPIITDIDKIEAAEATRQRYLQALRSMMTGEEREEVDHEVPQAGHIRGMAGDHDGPVPASPAQVEPREEGQEGI